ncbi:MAG TPA: TlpA disulfide reductase family protein [Bacteroidales bacterium]|nr:TlpA disulfide reductase family protein [Bacteroidales bacterium]HPT21723.1 TlpA disulfide reductase family protein [Bacteroidales bacterium]
MHKKLIIYLFAALAFTGCKKNTAHISGQLVSPVNGEYVYLDELNSNNLKAVDSIKVQDDGKFSFKIGVKTPAFYLLKVNQYSFLTMLVAPGEEIIVKAHNDSLNTPRTISGSKGTEKMADYNKTLRNTIYKLSELNHTYTQNIDSPELPNVVESLDSMAQSYLNEINLYTKKYIDENLSSLISLIALYQQVAPNVYVLNPTADIRYFVKVDSSLSKLYPDYEPVRSLHTQVQELVASVEAKASVAPSSIEGTEAPEIALPTPEGDTIRLSSTRGSIVLLDFWASWCSPCRQENPNLVNAYNQYHKKGFQIYQVSLDKTKEAWVKGIQDDQLGKWIHVSDVQYWNSVVVPVYKIESIPANLLLDREGRIIASNLRGAQLQAKLAELFNK